MGEAINHLFESELQWSFDNGIFYINGRDVICIMAGVCLGVIIVIFLQFIKEVAYDLCRNNEKSHKSKS